MEPDKESDDNICRDYLRNVCKRGNKCKFRHSKAGEPEVCQHRKQDYVFCHDFQNKNCKRENCKFIHCTAEEEKQFKTSGELPSHVMMMAIRKGIAPDLPIKKGEAPICKDYLKGDCRRGSKCKFRHLSSEEYMLELYGNNIVNPLKCDEQLCEKYDPYEPEPKRCHYDEMFLSNFSNGQDHLRNGSITMTQVTTPCQNYHVGVHVQHLEDQNDYLKRRVHELKKQVEILAASNEFLLEQNAQLRLRKQATTSVTHVNLPTVNNTITPAQQTIAQISTQLPLTSEISVVGAATQSTPLSASQVAASAVVGSVATVPVSISQGTAVAIATPVSLTPVSLTQPMPTVTISQNIPSITLNSVAPLVSYPIASQSVRPLITSSMAP